MEICCKINIVIIVKEYMVLSFKSGYYIFLEILNIYKFLK